MTPLMSSAIPSAALTASSPLSSMDPDKPLTSISPTHAISFEGEWIPKKSQIPSQMEEIHPDTLSHSQEASWVMPLHSPLTMLPPISTILYIREPKAFTMPAMICGTALTISTMMVGRFSIRATNNCTPAMMILSMFPTSALTMPEIICGIACTIVVMICGRA